MVKYEEKLSRLVIILCFFISLFIFSGCKKEKEVQKVVPVTPVVVEEKKEVIQEEVTENEEAIEYEFDAEGKRDPFKPFIKKQKVKIVKETVPLTPLQRFDVTQLKLTGIITSKESAKSRAMVEDPTGKGYILKIGTLIGKNFGRVTKIKPNEVIVTEEVEDFLGNVVTKEIPLTLEIQEGE